jgi:hypothetical protein
VFNRDPAEARLDAAVPPLLDVPRGGVDVNLGSRGAVFWLQLVYLLILFSMAYVYTNWGSQLHIPGMFGLIPIGVPWFGALGAVMISLTGVFDHAHGWDEAYKYWHWSRPVVGAAMSVVAILIMQAGLLSVTGANPPSSNTPGFTLYYVIAFLVAYREQTFRELIKRATDVVLSPGTQPTAPTVTSMAPQTGPVAGGTPVVIEGSGLTHISRVAFGATSAFYRVDSDTHITVTAPAAPPPAAGGAAPAPVSVVVSGPGGKTVAGTFTYG